MDVPVDISRVCLETPRLCLRPWRWEDLADFYAYASVPGVGEQAGWPHHETLEDSRKILGSFMEEKDVFALEEKETGRVIGSLGLHEAEWANEMEKYAPLRMKEVGYVLAQSHWGRGLMPEAVRRVIDWCFDEVGLDALTVGHFMGNSQSRRVIEKCGFAFEKKGVFHAGKLNRDFEEMQYILFRGERKK